MPTLLLEAPSRQRSMSHTTTIARLARRGGCIGAVAAMFVLLLSGACIQANASERLEPPLEALYAPTTTLISAKLAAIRKPDHLVFRYVRRLHGGTAIPDHIAVLADHDAIRMAHVGGRYVAALQLFVEDQRRPGHLVANPAGPLLLSQPGLDPALFRDDHTMRWLLRAARSESLRESRGFVRRLIALLRGPDPGLQRLAVNELVLEPELASRLTNADREIFRHIVLDRQAQPRVRTPLLIAASQQPARFGLWWKQAACHLVETTPTDGYATASPDAVGLVLTAFEVLELHHVPLPPPALERWVRGSSPNLAEHALLGLREQVPAREKGVVEAALSDPSLPHETRIFLVDHLRRLERIEARRRRLRLGSH